LVDYGIYPYRTPEEGAVVLSYLVQYAEYLGRAGESSKKIYG